MTDKKLVLWIDPDGGRHEIRAVDMADAQEQISALRKELGFPEPSASNNVRMVANEINKGFVKPEDRYIDSKDLSQKEQDFLRDAINAKDPNLN